MTNCTALCTLRRRSSVTVPDQLQQSPEASLCATARGYRVCERCNNNRSIAICAQVAKCYASASDQMSRSSCKTRNLGRAAAHRQQRKQFRAQESHICVESCTAIGQANKAALYMQPGRVLALGPRQGGDGNSGQPEGGSRGRSLSPQAQGCKRGLCNANKQRVHL